MAMKTLQDALLQNLRELYGAEKQLLKALPRMTKKATNEELRQSLELHQQETQRQVERLEQAFAHIEKKPRAEKNEALTGLLSEADRILKEDAEPELRDAMMIAAEQQVEHFEIAAYGTARTWASTLGLDQVAQLLEETLSEEKKTDDRLNKIARRINPAAMAGAGR